MPEGARQSGPVDLFVIGGGINGCGIARDAAGRGLSVTLAEMGDLGQATSSASTKLFHGGLRYLEYFEFRLVREALVERETLLRAMPHISWPMRFVLPLHPRMRFDSNTPTSRLLARLMPWMKGRRPAWLIRLGLFLYDHLGGREILPGTRTLDLRQDPAGRPLRESFERAFEYSDCWVEDSRLVVLNARDAEARGAEILPRARVLSAERAGDLWRVTVERGGGTETHLARALVNAAGPWAGDVIGGVMRINSSESVRLVRGSHIVTRRLFDHDKAYFFQGSDGRIIFAIPYETDFTLIGTTDREHEGQPGEAVCTEAEQDYLCDFASQYFARPVTRADIVWTYSGVRPLYDDLSKEDVSAVTRDYAFDIDDRNGTLPLLSVYGGKLTTFRKLSEHAMEELGRYLPNLGGAWTDGASLPGGRIAYEDFAGFKRDMAERYAFLGERTIGRLLTTYGTDVPDILGGAQSVDELGEHFGLGLYERELDHLMEREFVTRVEDVLFRRTKLGLDDSDGELRRRLKQRLPEEKPHTDQDRPVAAAI
jgi:glycerol-3-phosphate dehydrogenase